MKKPILFALAAAVVLAVSLLTVHAADQPLPSVGQVAPTFTLPSQDGSQISLESFRGKWVVLYFYPKDMTQGCTIEAHNFQRDQAKFDAANAVILGVSVDTPDLQAAGRPGAQGGGRVRFAGPLCDLYHRQPEYLPH